MNIRSARAHADAAAQAAGEGAARRRHFFGMALAIAGAVLFSGKGVLIKLAYRDGADPVSLIGLRMAFALPFFVLAAWWVGRAEASNWQPGDRLRVVGLGLIGYYGASFLDFLGLQYVSVGLERLILYLNPTLVLLGSRFWLSKPIAPIQWLALLTSYAGVALVFWHDVRIAGSNVPLGGALVLGSAALYAVYLIGGGEMLARIGTMRMTAWASIVASLACLSQALLIDTSAMFRQSAYVYGLSAVNGTLCTVAPIFMLMFAVRALGPGLAAQAGMIGPVSTIALGVWLLGEQVSGVQAFGTAVVLAGVFMLTVRGGARRSD